MWLVWVARVWLAVGNAASLSFTIGVIVLYGYFLTDIPLQIGLKQLGANHLKFLQAFITATTATTIAHLGVICWTLSLVRRIVGDVTTFISRPRVTRVQPSFANILPASLQAAGDRIVTNKTMATRAWTRYSAEITRLFMVWEVALQTFQACKISYLVASVSINRLIALVIVTNCWFSPILHYVMGSRPAAHIRLGRLMLDSSLDFIYNVMIPLAIFYPYYRDFDGSVYLYPFIFYYDDTWYVSAISELRQIFVTSWADFISKTSGSFALVYRMWKVTNALEGVVGEETKMRTDRGPVRAEVESVASVASPQHWYRSRLSRLLDLVLLVWGGVVCSLHLTSSITSYRYHDPGCLLETRPWGSLKYSCSSFEISCSKHHTTGDRESMEAIFSTVDPLSVQALILSNCPELHVPSSIQQMQYLTMIKIYNSTITSWDANAALRDSCHPHLQVLFFSRVNASGIPEGLIAPDFPPSVWDIEFCITNITAFPPEIATAWSKVAVVALEGNAELTEFPDLLTTLPNLFMLYLGMNSIKTIPDSVLETCRFGEMSMNGNPVERLPERISSIDFLSLLDFVDTKIDAIPTSWMEKASHTGRLTILRATGTPLCESNRGSRVVMPTWLVLNCEVPLDSLYIYPIQEEDAWRSINK